jgi:hypothetical protein
MAKRKLVDGKALLKMIKDGTPQADILEKFGFKNSTQLKVAYANALMDSGEATAIKGAARKAKPVNTKVKVNGKGTLTIPKALIESLNIEVGKTFEVKKSSKGLTLTSV